MTDILFGRAMVRRHWVVPALVLLAFGGSARAQSSIPLGNSGSQSFAYNPATHFLYAAQQGPGSSTLNVINTLSNTVAGSITYTAGYAAQASASGATVFVPDQSNSLVRVFTVNGSGVPSALRSDPASLATGSAALASNYAVTKQGTGDYLDINAVSNGANQHTTLVGLGAGNVFSDSNTNQYYANYSGGAKVVNADTGALVRSLASQVLAVDPAATHNFVYQIGTASVLNQLSGATNAQTGTYDFGVGASVGAVAVNPANGDVFVAIQTLNKIVELTPAMTYLRQFSIASPQAIAVADGELFVDSAGAGSLSVILINPINPPAIASVSSTSGQVGTSITITGTNFSSVPGNNIVYFGATRAVVTAASATSLTVTVPSGATYAPISVTVNHLTAYTPLPFTVTFHSGRIINGSSFAAHVDFTTGANPYWIAVGDLDGDGKPDIAVADFYGQAISIYRDQSSAGTVDASSFASKIDVSTGTNLPTAVAIADIDGDGKLDLIVTNGTSNTVSIFLNTTVPGGAISFASKVDLPTGSYANHVAVGDLDGDGNPDIVVANSNDTVISVLRNVGMAGLVAFAPKVDLAVTRPSDVAIGDIDGDGKPDIVATSHTNSTVSVLRNNSTVGTLSFATATDFAVLTGSSRHAETVVLADFNGDGKLDLAVGGENATSLSVLQNTSSSGAISFAPKIDLTPPDFNQYGIAVGDLDGDGRPDLVASNWSTPKLSIWRNSSAAGATSFQTQVSFTSGSFPRAVAIADFDGDGRPDLASANFTDNSVSVFRNTISIQPVITSLSNISGPVGATIVITGSNFDPIAANNTVYFGGVRAVVIAATSTSLTVIVPPGAAYAPITITVGGLTVTTPTSFIPTVHTSGALDASAFSPKVDFTTDSAPVSIKSADLDGDGRPDLIVINHGSNTAEIYRNTSTAGNIDSSAFAVPIPLTTDDRPQVVAVADLDGDGRLDVALVSSTNNTLSVFQNTSSVGAISFAARLDFTTGVTPVDLAIGDLDEDGRMDIAVANGNAATVSVFVNTSGIGSISFAPKLDLPVGTVPVSVAMGDLDGDGWPDLVVANGADSTISVIRNLSSFASAAFAARIDFVSGSNPEKVALGDFDGDGKLDIVSANSGSDSVSILRNISSPGSITTASFSAKIDFTTGSNPQSVAVGDLDGDGKLDLVSANFNADSVSVLQNTGAPGTLSFAAKADISTGAGAADIAIGDFDGDGKADLAVVNSNAATLSILRNVLNLAPKVSAVADQTIPEDSGVVVGLSVSDAESSPASLVVTGSSSDTGLVPNDSLVPGGSGSNRTLQVTPAANQFGTATITLSVSDGSATTTTTFLLTVLSVNDAPTLNPIADIAIDENEGQQMIDLAGITSGAPNESQTLTVTAASNNTNLIPDPSVSYTSPQTSGTLTFTPIADATGTATITVAVQDNGGIANGGQDTIIRTFTVTVRTPLQTWQTTNFTTQELSDPNFSGPSADPDYDGIPNALEYAFDLNPQITDVTALPQVGLEGNFITLTYRKNLSATDLNYIVEESADLIGWGPASVTEEIVSETDGVRVIKAKVPIENAQQKFLHLKVTF